MALQELKFTFDSTNSREIPCEWSHLGVAASGDLEVLFERKQLGGKVEAKVVTPVRGFDEVWRRMIAKFVADSGIGNLCIEINDDNATPVVVYMRLRQALAEAMVKEGE